MTRVTKENLLPKKKLEQELAKGFVCVVFKKLNGEERTLCGTTIYPKGVAGEAKFYNW